METIEPKLGCLQSHADHRTIALAELMTPHVLPLPPTSDWDTPGLPVPMFGNDRLGDCVIAALAHRRLVDSNALERTPDILTDDQVIAHYSRITGYDPAIPGTDSGTEIIEALKDARNSPWEGRQLYAYARLKIYEGTQAKRAINWFGGVILAIALPEAWRGAKVWTIAPGYRGRPGTWGLHAVVACRYDPEYLYVRSWGQIIPMHWSALAYYGQEAWTALGSDWATRETSPIGLDLGYLAELLGLITDPARSNNVPRLGHKPNSQHPC